MGVLIEKTTVVHRLEKNGTASPGLVYEAFVPVIPPKKTLWQLMYSRKSGKILGRTPRNWGALLIFYTIFMTILAALFAICMKSWLMSCPERMPKYLLGESLIGSSPGVAFRPISPDTEQGALIWFDASDSSQVDYWKYLLDDFLQDYNSDKVESKRKNCDFDNFPGTSQACKFDIKKLGPCTSLNAYGFNSSSPCIFIKLNKIYGWVPEFYNDPNDLPSEMPTDLQDYISELPERQRNQVWISCDGENEADREIIGNLSYFPSRGLPAYFYPYLNAPGYLSPLVSVKLLRPTPNQIINIECRAWAKNIKYVKSSRDRQGSAHIELQIDVAN